MAATKTKSKSVKAPLFSKEGVKKEDISLMPEIFQLPENPALLAQYVRVYLHNKRNQNAHTKTRGEVVGSTRKIYRQKGTGRARHGSIKAPIFVGGGIVFGPQSKNTTLKMNTKQKKRALAVALSKKAQDAQIWCIENDILSMKPQTKAAQKCIDALQVTGRTLCVVHPDKTDGFSPSVKNIKGISAIHIDGLNAYEALRAKSIVFTQEALEMLKKRYENS